MVNDRLKAILTRSVHRNVLVFDVLAPSGIFTARLIRLMKSQYKQIFNMPMKFLVIPEKTMGDFIHENFETTVVIDGVYISLASDSYDFDIKDVLINELKVALATAGGNHLEEDKEFAIGYNTYPFAELNNNCECLLGSF